MNYGFSAKNDYGSVTINSEMKVLVFSERGSLRITSRYTDRGGTGEAVFIKPIRTLEPPQVFIRHVSGLHSSLGLYAQIIGGPGAWTGFVLRSAASGGSTLQNFLIEFVACKFADAAQLSGYGMNIRDAAGGVVFSTQDRPVRYSKFATSWTRTFFSEDQFIFTPNVTIDADDFICISALDRGLNWFAEKAQFAAMNILSNGQPNLNIYAQVMTAGGDWYYDGTGGTTFGVAVCKFPESRYYN
ncbi:hypothetical protein SAMN02745900_04478 [Pseudomonas sp. URIL14HWK12:I8]|uniref:hypothetical protein n=1 Tax=unclassified Pseudomonas TaxID=196821 RepID=UPI000B74CCAD|nr:MULTISPECIES: hypothetical protein [unclassified Pseudomonas]SNB84689.1 hypothetical protein SAMN02745900_04478 [Pseudomonas sp. URIL14HWK12:I8]